MKIDKKEILDFAKKNVLSIISGVVALLALVALYWPVMTPMYSSLQDTLGTRKAENDVLQRLRTANRNWPALPDSSNTIPVKLTLFPNRERIDKANEIKEHIHDQAQKIKTETAKNNAHEQLVEGVLPQPGEKRFLFATAYQEMMAKTLPAELRGATPPTDAEIHAAADQVWINDYAPKIVKVAGKEINRAGLEQEWGVAAAKLPAAMRLQRASTSKLYLDKDAISLNRTVLNNPQGPPENVIWYAQNMLWVERDLAAAIERINADSNSVMSSTIKHLVLMHVADDQNQYATAGPGAAAGAGGTAAGFERSITGRLSNATYDVIDFSLTMNVDARKIPEVIAELERGKLITVTQVNATSVDGVAAAENGFIYGDVPVARVVIHGEDIFLRDWTTPMMPDSVKTQLGIAATNAAEGGSRPH